MATERQAISRKRGKWSDPGVPHRGWIYITVEDLGSPNEICQMCETSEIRYAHIVRHQNYLCDLRVGCVCAENLTQDYSTPKVRERAVSDRNRRRLAWIKKQWRASQQGNPHFSAKGWHFTVFKKGRHWRVAYNSEGTEKSGFLRPNFDTEAMAKAACFDFLEENASH
jgi:hypothetical protein